MIKAGWEEKRLGEVCSLINRGVSPKYLESGGISVLNQRCIRDHQINTDFSRRHDLKAKQIGSEKIIRVGDVLVNSTGTGTLGRVAQVREEPSEPTTVDSHVTIVRPIPGKFYPEFFGYVLRNIEPEIQESGDGCGGQIELARSVLSEKFTVKYPTSLFEQQRIARILDEAFEAIATAKANAEKNLQNARTLFESHLCTVFSQGILPEDQKDLSAENTPIRSSRSPTVTRTNDAEMSELHEGYVSRTGGREATNRNIYGGLSLAVGRPSTASRNGWRWSLLSDVARLESGHTPSRRHPEYWGGDIPWIGIQDARINHGRSIQETSQTINELGTANSSARLLPKNTVCLSRTASVGYVVIMGRPMATSQDFVNWVCSNHLLPEYLKYVFLAEGRDGLLRYASGSVHQTIYFPEAKAFYICHPGLEEQRRIIDLCDSLRDESELLDRIYREKLYRLEDLKKAFLHQAFSGKLTSSIPRTIIPFLTKVPGIPTADLHAGLLAIAFQYHETNGNMINFGHVKAEKISHMIESHLGIELERNPLKDAAGPNDFQRLNDIDKWAESQGYFKVRKVDGRYHYTKLSKFEGQILKVREILGDKIQGVIKLMQDMVGMDKLEAEVFATVYAAWNNLLLDAVTPSDERIVWAAREDWHIDKKDIPREKFFAEIDRLRREGYTPKGKGKRVLAKDLSL